jgi:regulator of protease activity HflC (stomatin/prohibitin superfamily)
MAFLAIAAIIVLRSLVSIGPAEVGMVTKRFSLRKLKDDDIIAFNGEPGYQADLLMPGLRFKLWPIFTVSKHPWVQVPAGEIGVIISQVGAPLAVGAKSAVYNEALANFSDLRSFLANGGQKGVQRPVLPPGSILPLHPSAFIVLTPNRVFGMPTTPELTKLAAAGQLTPESFGLIESQLQVTVIAPQGDRDYVGIVTALEGQPLEQGDIASRLGGYEDIRMGEINGANDAQIVEQLLGSQNGLHNNYQDFQKFIDHGGRIGLQHDPILYGAYLLNPFLVRVELVPMLVVNQGQVAVVKSFVGLPTIDTSGEEFKFGSIVAPGHRGIWREPLRTGKYPINPRCYAAEIVPTSIITLNWANANSQAHSLDAHLSPIEAKSREGFVFTIDLQVQIHVPDTRAPKVISMVGTMMNLVNEVLQSAVGNHFRNTLQQLEAIKFIETRHEVQAAAFTRITDYLTQYQVETKGVYIQDVQFPSDIVEVLTTREIANQEKATFEEQQRAQLARIELEKTTGTADQQANLAASQVGITIKQNQAEARRAEAAGEAGATVALGEAEAQKQRAIAIAQADAIRAQGISTADSMRAQGEAQANTDRQTGLAKADASKALGLAQAAGYEAQRLALGEAATAAVNIVDAIGRGDVKIMPEILVSGGSGGPFEALAAALTRLVQSGGLASVEGHEGVKAAVASATPTPQGPTSSGPTPQGPTSSGPK